MLEDGAQLLSDDLFQRVDPNVHVKRFAVLMDDLQLRRGFEDLLVHRSLDHDARLRLLLPWKPGADRESLLASRMGIILNIALAGDLHGGVLIQQLRRRPTGFPDGAFHLIADGHAFQAGEVQVLREAVFAEIALLECRAALEYERLPEQSDLSDAGENPGEQVISFEDFPGNAEPLAGFLEAGAKRPHGSTLPGRFSWIIQCALVGPLRGPVGSSVR